MPSDSWNWAWGTQVWCDSLVIIDHLSKEEPSDVANGSFLARADDDESWILVPGERNFRGRCQKTTCEMVYMAAGEAQAVAAAIAGTVVGTNVTVATTGVTVVAHSSGAWIMTGPAGYIAGTLGTAGTALVGYLTAVPALVATGVTVVALGSAVYVCSE